MPTNPFRRKTTQRGSSSSSSASSATAASTNPNNRNGQKQGGLTIAAGGASQLEKNGLGPSSQKQPPPLSKSSAPLLPPESDYRTSLIMPHLTKRFTLLRAPDGTMVTPDAMRAHLRAQRARARATGVPGTQCFLTEEEEDEIIDQLKRQTRMEEMESWNQIHGQGADEGGAATKPHDPIQFGGTDGFGSWATPTLEQQARADSQIDSSLTESLGGALQSSASTSSREGGSGGFFTSRSSTSRDLAYMREVERSRAARRENDQPTIGSEADDGREHIMADNHLPLVEEEEDDTAATEKEADLGRGDDDEAEAGDVVDPDETMPGDFLVAERRQSRRLSSSDVASSRKGSDTSTLTPRPNHARQPALLTSLTPEAFSRVSSALEEVYEMVQGKASDSEEEVTKDEALGSQDKGRTLEASTANLAAAETEGSAKSAAEGETEQEEQEEELEGDADETVAVYRRHRAPHSPETDTISLPKTSTDEGSTRIRASIDSETNSFTSARSDVVPSALGNYPSTARSEAFAGIGAAAMTNLGGTVPSAPAGWQVSPASARLAPAADERPPFARQGKSSLSSIGSASLQSNSTGSPASRTANLISLDPANGRMRIERGGSHSIDSQHSNGVSSMATQQPEVQVPPPSTPTAPPFVRSPINSFLSSAPGGPLSAGFQSGGMAPSEKAAAAAAATAAGVAASNFVAQAQKEERYRKSLVLDLAPSSPPKSEITVGQMPSIHDDERDVPHDGDVPTAANLSPVAQGPVLSAGAIAARSPRYFPNASRQSMRTYAAGFLPSAPMPTDESVAEKIKSETSASNVPATSATSTLLPAPPVDAVEGIKWRERYGMAASADARSVRSAASFNISEDDDADDEAQEDEEDVWARVARNTSPKVEPRRISALQGNSDVVQPSMGMVKSGSGMSLDALAQMQNDLVRSASALRNGANRTKSPFSSPPPSTVPAYPPPAPPPQDRLPQAPTSPASLSRSSDAPYGNVQKFSSESDPIQLTNRARSLEEQQMKLEKARGKARMIAEQRATPPSVQAAAALATTAGSSDSSSPAQVAPTVSAFDASVDTQAVDEKAADPVAPNKTPLSSIPLERETSMQSSRSQVLYDVTSSHRPTSPPPRSHKTSISNLPSLHDLTRGPQSPTRAAAVAAPSAADRTSVSLLAMMETNSRVHDQLAAGGDTSLTRKSMAVSIPETEEFEDVQIEDGFGGFTTERRRIPRSQSHRVLSKYGKQLEQQREEAAKEEDGKEVIQHTPKSVQSDSAAQSGGTTWSRLPGEEPYVNPVLIDDVAAQARAATRALKGEQMQRPRMRTKSLSNKARRTMLNNISQPQLVSTSQRMEHARDLAKVDASLRRREIAAVQEQIKPRTSSRQQGGTRNPSAGSMMQRSASGNTIRSPSSSPTDYKAESMAVRKPSVASSQLSRSSSFGTRNRAESVPPGAVSAAPAATIAGRTRQSPGTPTQQTGLGRFMSRLRSKKGNNDLPAAVEPFPNGAANNVHPSPAYSSPKSNTPGSLATPKFHTPKESPAQITPSPNVGGYPGKLSLPKAGNTPLSEMFASSASTAAEGAKDAGPSSLAPAAPIHARHARPQMGARQDPPTADGSTTMTQSSGDRRSARTSSERRSARGTIVRRTIIVSTYDPIGEERRKSLATAGRKGSIRKQVDRQSHVQAAAQAPPAATTTAAAAAAGHHRRTSSLSSMKSRRRSLHDRPPTPPGPDGVSGTHRRKLSQEITGRPLPATARNVYEAPIPVPGQRVSTLHIPNPSLAGVRASGVSDYGASLYDMYIDDEEGERSRMHSFIQPRASNLAPPSSKHSSAVAGRTNEPGGQASTRHIEVTERADGSVVWQVIAGLADRSSSYSASIDYRTGGGHSRQTSDTSQYSFLRNANPGGPGSQPNAYADEDGRSLFARTRGKKSFSMDGDSIPPLPAGAGVEGGSSSTDQKSVGSVRPSISSNRSHPAQQLDFEMALPPGQAATRIVYTSDAELAAILESLAGPDKSSAKFAFQRVLDEKNGGGQRPGSASANGGEGAGDETPMIGSVDVTQQPNGGRRTGGAGRPVSIWTEEEQANDPTGMVRNQRIKIEAEIYSLLQRGQAVDPSPPPVLLQDASMPPPPVPPFHRSSVPPPQQQQL